MKHFISALILLFGLIQLKGQDDVFERLKPPIPELPTASLSEVGLHNDTIQRMLQLIRGVETPDFRGLVVIKDNKLVVEEHFYYWRENIHDIRSAGKSVTAILLGIAIDKGFIKDVEQPVYEFFPKAKVNIPLTEDHYKIKIKHLLMMSSGLDADSDDINTPGNGIRLIGSKDWIEFGLNLPIAFETGSRWVYNDVCAMLCGAIVQSVTGQNLSEFAERALVWTFRDPGILLVHGSQPSYRSDGQPLYFHPGFCKNWLSCAQ